MADCYRHFHQHHHDQPPFAFTGPADKFTRCANPRLRQAQSDLTKPPEAQFPASQRSPTVGGPNPGHTVMHRELRCGGEQGDITPADRLPREAHWERFDPRLRHPPSQVASIDTMSREDFARYRDQKDRNLDKVPRAPNVLQSNHCDTCAFPWANVYGCSKDAWYYTQHPEYRDINKFPRPHTLGWYGYSHEQLDRHNTGNFWSSKKHT